MKTTSLLMGLILGLALTACEAEDPQLPARESTASPSKSSSSIPAMESDEYVGFVPQSRTKNGTVFMPLTFVDGSSAEIEAAADLRIQDMSAAVYTAGGVDGVDRTLNFRYGQPGGFTHEGPLETYEGNDSGVEVWEGTPGDWECPNLVFRFGDWFVAVRTCQNELSVSDKELWARSLRGQVMEDGFLVLSADPPLVLQETGGHEGPELILGMDYRANWIELEPGRCDPAQLPDEGDIRTMNDGTRVSFSRIGGGKSKIEYNWFATWCEDGLITVQVSYAYEDFAVAAAEGFRMRDITVAE